VTHPPPGWPAGRRTQTSPYYQRAMSRFSEPPSQIFRAMNDSLAFDRRLARFDVRQSRAHVAMLAGQGIITDADREELERALGQVEEEVASGSFPFAAEDEDIHMAIERRVTELAGRAGGRLHTARSRNDQVATDVAMYVREATLDAEAGCLELAATLIELAERHLDWPMPGYTHLQRAQPVYLSHHLLAYVWMLLRDAGRFRSALAGTAGLPLGAGALAGVNFETDRDRVAHELGFERPAENSIDAVSNRDFVLDYLAAATVCSTHLSRLGAEVVLWSSEEFGFCEVSDAWASGSSIMPQKKNPDVAELLRAKAPRVSAHFSAFAGVLHGLPLTYNKDMQEDKEHLFDAADTLELSLAAARGMMASIRFERDRLAAAAADEFLAATDIADLLVRRGLPFREAHGVVAGLVRRVLSEGRLLSDLDTSELRQASDLLDEQFYELLAQRAWLESKTSAGGTSLAMVRNQIQQARERLQVARADG
jgi:argininosuccinate lyase